MLPVIVPVARNGGPSMYHLDLPHPVVDPSLANTAWTRYDCGCPRPCYRLLATTTLAEGEAVYIPDDATWRPDAPGLLLRFDGSCKTPKRPRCGGGFAIWRISTTQQLDLLLAASISLPWAINAQQAEAFTSGVAMLTACDCT